MADIAGTYTFSAFNAITHRVTYETQRSGTTIRTRFKIDTTLKSGYYFGYNIKLDISVGGQNVVTGGVIKNNSPNKWGTITTYWPSSTGWYSTGGIKDQTNIAAFINLYSNANGNYTYLGSTVNIPRYVFPSAPSNVSVNNSIVAHNTTNFVLSWSGASGGTAGISKYRVYYYSNGSRKHLLDTSGSNCTINLNGIESRRGVTTDFLVSSIDSNGLQSGESRRVGVKIANLPTVPTTFTVTKNILKKSESFTLNWSGARAGDGSITKYQLDCRKNTNGTNTTWKNVYSQATTSYTSQPKTIYSDVKSKDTIQFRVRTVNSYGLNSDYIYITVTIKGGIIRVKVNGIVKEATLFYKQNGVVKEVSSINYKQNGVVKELV